MTVLSQHQNDLLKHRFPKFELSYETVTHKNVPTNYNLALAIPNGRKSYIWFSFFKDMDVAYLMDLDKDKRIVKTSTIPVTFNPSLSVGTILYGVMLPDVNVFIIEDIHFYKGFPMQALCTGERFHYMNEFLNAQSKINSNDITFHLPVLWYNKSSEPEKLEEDKIPYPIHHIQYRALSHVVPFLNYTIVRKPVVEKDNARTYERPISNMVPDFRKPQYKVPTIFRVTADIQFDIYQLYACGNGNEPIYVNTAFIPNYKTSVFMNQLFRNIKENRNLDYIEESDDEADFQDIREDRFVDLEKTLNMECVFNHKFKRWVPVRVIQGGCRVVGVDLLRGLPPPARPPAGVSPAGVTPPARPPLRGINGERRGNINRGKIDERGAYGNNRFHKKERYTKQSVS
jgi:hypothetical protein